MPFKNPEDIASRLSKVGYFSDKQIATAIYLAYNLEKPLLIEGPAGVGKTEVALAVSQALKVPLLRLQCYPGLDEAKALYEWNYQKQLLFLQTVKNNWQEVKKDLYSEEFLLPRPLLKALTSATKTVLLIDEIDKSDEEFESFLLETLAEYAITIPELGRIKAKNPPFIIITSNNSRELSDALRRRCLYLYLDYPAREREVEIILNKVPGIDAKLAGQIVDFANRLRARDLKKKPSIAETVEMAKTIKLLNLTSLNPEVLDTTLGVLLKHWEDLKYVKEKELPNYKL
ncbi:AAA family ATPase [Carboxydothermus hydrogenoformans]|uniref:ATPase, AAA family n=1 Tax=Carboxydothermus hydrogenoformans (strain ATCC BAA-161 / DSM 6008 / Z-2901) TaxID=246194 RepID=Q3ACW2_CARHZ|nr:MoxR family ATPase [Carboxydothermus hydrogenoformans]ABB16000.1 ATPase, AAA family [Carboxydothermus hydrogenoformans Z-2901]